MSGFHFYKGHQYKCTMKKTLPELYFKRLSCRVLLWNFDNFVDRRFYLFGAFFGLNHFIILPCWKDPKCRSEIPEYLRIIAKPVVDAILAGKPLSDEDLLKRILDC